ncbi:MAG: pantoate--beta-alanine ligase [Phycisphaerales bacterium]
MRILTEPNFDLTASCVLVPTMGSLHAGHESLLKLACSESNRRGVPAAATVFVNPTQFNEATDFDRYPRDLDRDAEVCERCGIDVVFAPSPEIVYPPGEQIPTPELPAVATEPGLEDTFRPGHFPGVCQVVSRCFDLCDASAAIFGEKDWQQLQVVRAMAEGQQASRGRLIEIVPGSTVREPEGLAMSSRNLLLTAEARAEAVGISTALTESAQEPDRDRAEAVLQSALRRAGIAFEYAVLRDAKSLLVPGPMSHPDGPNSPCRLLVAARVGGVRLIDNMPWLGHQPQGESNLDWSL